MLELLMIVSTIVVVYFLPIIIAKDKPNVIKVSIITILTGWTIVGWIVAFTMAKKTFELKRKRGRPKGTTQLMKSILVDVPVPNKKAKTKRKKSSSQ